MSFQLFFKSYGRYLGLLCLVSSFVGQAGPGFSCCNGDIADQVEAQPSRTVRYTVPVGVWYPKAPSRRHVRRRGVVVPCDTFSIQVAPRGEHPDGVVAGGPTAINSSTVPRRVPLSSEESQSTRDVDFSGAIFES